MGNICRSPTAEGVLRKKLALLNLTSYVLVDSAGTHNYHPNAPADRRSQEHARQRGYDLANLRARSIKLGDFEQFDLLLAMDWDNLALLQERCPCPYQHKVRRFTEFLKKTPASVIPDPYYGGESGFEDVLDLIEEASDGLIEWVLKKFPQEMLDGS